MRIREKIAVANCVVVVVSVSVGVQNPRNPMEFNEKH